MLYLHHSNQLELLAAQFAALQRTAPLEPMQQELVVVQNSGMGRWLSLQTAEHNGIAANLCYLFPAELTWELLRAVLSEHDVPPQDPCAPHILRWRLLDILVSEAEVWRELTPYLHNGDTAAWQLAGQLAKVFDQYLFFRPQWIRAWEAAPAEHAHDWQARLWQRVAGAQHLPHWVRLQDRFAHALSVLDPRTLPQRISFFSVPVLSPGYVQLLGAVAQYTDIHIFLLNPCQEYWGDIESEKRKRKQQTDVQAYFSVGNPLLASWGRQGRDFIDLLIDAGADIGDLPLFIPPEADTLLAQIQRDIVLLQMPTPLPNPPSKASLSFHACHSPMREAEVLYDQLLELFTQNPDLTPADVVVMTPDIDTYAPYLDAVFASAPHPLPYSIADRSPGYAQSILNLCTQLLELPQGRGDAESILALLEFAEVRTHLGLDEAAVLQCRHWIRAVNIRWGIDAQSRSLLGGAPTPEHTWRYGLDRLLLGYALPSEDLFAEILPWNEIEGSQAELLGRLQQWLDAIFTLLAWGQQQHTLPEWAQRFRHLLNALVGEDAPLQTVWQALDSLERTTQEAGFTQTIAWQVFQSALAEQLDKRSESEGFLGRGITCCALMPMRTVPFRFVALIGMNDGVFPRRDARASFDRMGEKIQRGDRLKRDEDRYLFLESLLSARDWLYISYVGQSAQDNSELPPSVLVSELLDYAERCQPGARETLLTKHPLQAFSQKYWRGEQGLFTYMTYQQPNAPQAQPVSLTFWHGEPLPEADPAYRHVTLADLIRFYRNPAREFLNIRFGLRLTETDEELPSREPFSLEGYNDQAVRASILQQLQRGNDVQHALPLLRAQGLLPHGKPGELLFWREADVTSQFFEQIKQLPALHSDYFRLNLGDFTLNGRVDALADDNTRYVYALGKLSYWSWLEIWLTHLFLNAQAPYETRIYTPENQHSLQAVDDAGAQLQQLLQWYWRGLHEPLPFFPKSAFKLNPENPDISKVMSTWEGSGSYTGECEKPEYRLLYRGINPLEQYAEAFIAISLGVFGRMASATT